MVNSSPDHRTTAFSNAASDKFVDKGQFVFREACRNRDRHTERDTTRRTGATIGADSTKPTVQFGHRKVPRLRRRKSDVTFRSTSRPATPAASTVTALKPMAEKAHQPQHRPPTSPFGTHPCPGPWPSRWPPATVDDGTGPSGTAVIRRWRDDGAADRRVVQRQAQHDLWSFGPFNERHAGRVTVAVSSW